MTEDLLVVGVDVGGTNIEVGLVSADHAVHARAKARTPTRGPGAVLDVIAELVILWDGRRSRWVSVSPVWSTRGGC